MPLTGSILLEPALTAFADVLALDGDARIDELPAPHGPLRYDRRRIVFGGVEDEVAGHVHVQLPGASHAPSQRCGAGIEFDPFATGIYGPVFGRKGCRGVTGLLGRQAARPGLSRRLASVHNDGFGKLPFAGRNAVGCRGLRHRATDSKPTDQD